MTQQLDWVGGQPPREFKDIRNTRPSVAEEKADLCRRMIIPGDRHRTMSPPAQSHDELMAMLRERGDQWSAGVSMTFAPPLTSREIALQNGQGKYWSGQRCLKGHDGWRYTASRYCVECSKAAKKKSALRKKAQR